MKFIRNDLHRKLINFFLTKNLKASSCFVFQISAPTSPFALEVLNEFLKIHPFESSLLYMCENSNQLFECLEKLNEIIINCDNRVRRLFSILNEYEATSYTEKYVFLKEILGKFLNLNFFYYKFQCIITSKENNFT